jgi:hypothetical protein
MFLLIYIVPVLKILRCVVSFPHLTYLNSSTLSDALVRSDASAAPGLSIHSLFSNQTKKPIN